MNNPHLVRKTTSPLSAPPEAGIHWINTATGEEYFSVGTSTVNDWIIRKNNGDWLNGNGVPSSVLGNDNDNYIDNISGNYYKKTTGLWVLQGSLKGATGSTGATGATGAPGSQIYTGSGAPSALLGVDTDFYINNVNWDYYKKIAGTWTLQGSFAAGVVSVAGKVGVVTLDIADVNNLQTSLDGKVSDTGDTITGPIIITGAAPIAGAMLRVTNTGSGDSFVVEDSTNPDSSRFSITSSGIVNIGGISESMSIPKVNVNAANLATMDFNAGTSAKLTVGATLSENRVYSLGNLIIYSDSSNSIAIEPSYTDFLGPSIYTYSTGTALRTGINNASPTEALDVGGNILASGTVNSSNLSGTNTGDETYSTITTKLGAATSSNNGYLSSNDWKTFNHKLDGYEQKRGYSWTNNSSTVTTEGIAAGSATGTAGAVSVASTNYQTAQVRSKFSVSTPALNGQCGYRSTTLLHGITYGFRVCIGFAHTDSQYNSGARQFYGLIGQTTLFGINSTTTVESGLNIIGIGSDSADTNLQIFHNDAAGVATKLDLGVNFPANRTAGAASTDFFRFELFNEIGSNSVNYRVISYATQSVATGTLSTNLPASSQLLAVQAVRTSGSSSNQCSFDISQLMGFTLS